MLQPNRRSRKHSDNHLTHLTLFLSFSLEAGGLNSRLLRGFAPASCSPLFQLNCRFVFDHSTLLFPWKESSSQQRFETALRHARLERERDKRAAAALSNGVSK